MAPKPLCSKKLFGCGGLQRTEAAQLAVSVQIASQASYPRDSTAS
jgi:hypothetical protein